MSAPDDELLKELGNAKVVFWRCPTPGHSAGDWCEDRFGQTVEWRGRVAHCLAPGCGRTSESR